MVGVRVQVTLHWPTALAINPLDDTLHILDNNMVLKLTKDHAAVLVVAGYPLHCPPIRSRLSALLENELAAPKLATEVALVSPQDISFSSKAELFIVESNKRDVSRVRVVSTDGTIVHYAGSPDRCECDGDVSASAEGLQRPAKKVHTETRGKARARYSFTAQNKR